MISRIWECLACKIFIYIIGTLLGLVVISFIFINPLLNTIVKPQILDSINHNTKTSFEIDELHFSFPLNSLFIGNLEFAYYDSSNSANDSIVTTAKSVCFVGINWLKLFSGNYSFDGLIISEPLIIMKSEIAKNGNDTSESKTSWGKHLTELLPEELKLLEVSKIIIDSGQLIRQSKSNEENINDSINNFSLIILDFDPEYDKEPGEFTLFENFELKIKGFHRRWNESGYDFKINSIEASNKNSSLNIDSMSFKPFVSDQEFFSRRKYRGDRWSIEIPELDFEGVNFHKILSQDTISVKQLTSRNFSIEIYTNKRLPLNPYSDPKMPHELISSLSFGLDVEKLQVEKGLLILESFVPNVERRAQLKFTNINGSILNVSNNPEIQNEQNPCVIDLSGKLQDAGNLKIKMNVPLLSDHFSFNYEGLLTEMSAKKLNSHLEVENQTSVKSGEIINISFSSRINRGFARVNIIPLYTNLEVESLDKEGVEENILESFITNTFLRESNPNDDGEIKSGNVNYITTTKDTFLDVIWLALLKGLGKVVGF